MREGLDPEVRKSAYADYEIGLEKLYFLGDGATPLREARYHGPIENGQKLNGLIREIHDGDPSFYAKKRLEAMGHDAQKVDQAHCNTERMKRAFFHNYPEPQRDLKLRHGTSSTALNGIVQLRGPAARKYFESLGLVKRYGGERGGSFTSYTGNVLSFSSLEQPEIVGGVYGQMKTFDYPMTFGISEENASHLRQWHGSMNEEVTVRDYVPMRFVDQVFVPDFMVDEVRAIFAFNQINVEVVAF